MNSILAFIVNVLLGVALFTAVFSGIAYFIAAIACLRFIGKHELAWRVAMFQFFYVLICIGGVFVFSWMIAFSVGFFGIYPWGCGVAGILVIVPGIKAIPVAVQDCVQKLKDDIPEEIELKNKVIASLPRKTKDVFLFRNEETIGPFSQLELQMALMEGKVSSTEWAWMEGMEDWKPLIQVVFK
jgi:hypothetical protein